MLPTMMKIMGLLTGSGGPPPPPGPIIPLFETPPPGKRRRKVGIPPDWRIEARREARHAEVLLMRQRLSDSMGVLDEAVSRPHKEFMQLVARQARAEGISVEAYLRKAALADDDALLLM